MAEKKTKTIRGKTEREKKKTPSKSRARTIVSKTHTGHRLTIKEEKFIDSYIETGNGLQSVIQAGYNTSNPKQYANSLLTKVYIAEEIRYRTQQISDAKIADAKEVMEYFSKVMRGEIRDQFGLDAPLSERTKAAQELAKRTVDIENRLAGRSDANVTISIDWKRDKEDGE